MLFKLHLFQNCNVASNGEQLAEPSGIFFFSSLSRSGRLHCFNTELCIRCVSGPLYCWTTSGFLRCPFQSFGLDYYSVRGCCYQSLLRLVTFRRLLVLPFSLLKPSLLFSLFFFLRLWEPSLEAVVSNGETHIQTSLYYYYFFFWIYSEVASQLGTSLNLLSSARRGLFFFF